MQASARLSSSAAIRKVIAGVSSATTRSCYRTSRGKAYAAAPLPVREPPLKGQKTKRATKLEERRVRIVEFVDNYRASNGGKFPTMTHTQAQVGGCFYTVRDVIHEMKYNHAKSHLANLKAPPLQGTVEDTEHPMPKDEARVAQLQGMLEVSEHSTPKDDAEVVQLQGTVQVSEHSTPKDDAEVVQLQGTVQVSEHSMPKDDAEVAQLQGTVQVSEHSTPKDDAEVVQLQGTVQVSEHSTPKDDAEVVQIQGTVQVSEHSTSQDAAEVAQLQGTVQVSEHSFPKDEEAPALSNQTESERMKDPTHAREDNPKLEESANTGLLGSLKSFAYGIRNFWKNM